MRGFNFLFAEGLRPVRHKDFTVDIDYPRVYRYPATGELYCLTSEIEDPYFGDSLLTWPCISRKSKIDGVFNIYPLCLKDEEEEADIFTSHVWQVFTRSKSHEKGKKKVFDFLDFQYKNHFGEESCEFIDKVVEILFASGRLLPIRGDITRDRLRESVWEWINKSRSELERLGRPTTMWIDEEYRDEVPAPAPTVAPLPTATSELEESGLQSTTMPLDDEFRDELAIPAPEINRRAIPDFSDLLSDAGKVILPAMKRAYTNAKPARLTPLLFALGEYSLLDMHQTSKAELHEVLKKEFGTIGTRQALNASILKYEQAGQFEEKQINTAKIFLLSIDDSLSTV